MKFIQKIIFILAFSYISYFFSERIFWSFFRPFPDDTLREFLTTLFAYFLLSYVAIGLIEHYRVTNWKGIFLVGAVYGWLGEGVVVTTLYGTTLGMWATISVTGLSWHALLTALFGWLFLTQALRGNIPARRFILLMIFSGLVWAFWAVNWGFEGKGWDVTPAAFIRHVWIYSLPLPVAYWILSKLSNINLKVSRIEWVVLGLFFGSLYLYWNFTRPIFPRSLILLPLLWLTIFGLKKYASRASGGHFLNQLTFSWKYGILLLLMPLTATLTYPAFYQTCATLHTNWVICIVTLPFGYFLYIFCIAKAFQQRKQN